MSLSASSCSLRKPLPSHQVGRRRAIACCSTAKQGAPSGNEGRSSKTDSMPMFHRRQLLAGVATGSASLLAMSNSALAEHQHTVVLPGALGLMDCREGITPAASTAVRKNIQDLSAGELLLLRKGVETMQNRPVEDKTSWRFQANIHGSVADADPSNSPLWNQCKHTSLTIGVAGLVEGRQFLAWHRGYLYFFERILAKAAGGEVGSLALPYWDWAKEGTVPLAYRELTYTDASGEVRDNPLLHDRAFALNNLINPTQLPSRAITQQVQLAERQQLFWTQRPNYGFNISLERAPHNNIHNFVGDDMGDPSTAGRDPVFWAHHANIDRLWNVWLNESNHNNLSDAAFLNTRYRFADADGTEVCVAIGDIIDATKLGYEYAGTPNPLLDIGAAGGRVPGRSLLGDEQLEDIRYEEVASSAPIGGTRSLLPDAVPLITPKPLRFAPEVVQLKAAGDAPGDAPGLQGARSLALAKAASGCVVEVEALTYAKAPAFGFDVLISRPGSDPAGGVYLGSLNFFSSPRGRGFAERFDATSAIEQLQLGEAELPLVTLQPATLQPTAEGSAGEEQAAAIRQAAEASVEAASLTYRRINLLKVAE